MNEQNTPSFFDEFPSVSTDEWETKIEQDLNGADYKKKLRWHTGEGVQPLPFYRREDLRKLDQVGAVTDGPKSTWEVREPIYGSTAQQANERAKRALQSGAEALQISMNLSVDKAGTLLQLWSVPIQKQSDFSTLLDNVPLEKTPIHFDAGPLSPAMMAMLKHEIASQEISGANITGSMLFDPFAIQLRHGIDLPLDTVLKIATFGKEHLPNMRLLGIDARLYHQSGGTIVQELGFALASAAELLATLTDNGFSIKELTNKLHSNFATGSSYFLEIAKFRAFRLLWSNLLDAFNADTEQASAYIHAETSRWNKTGYDPYTNMLRTSTEGMSAVLGNCDALTVRPFDESFRQPNGFSQRIARNSQIIMREEAHLGKVQDPAAGSYYIEQLTNDIAQEAWQLLQEVEEHGGMTQAIADGFVQSSINKSRQSKDHAIASREHIFVGTNQYPNPENNQAEELNEQKPTAASHLTDLTVTDPFDATKLSQSLTDGAALGNVASTIFTDADTTITQLTPYRGPQAFEELRLATEKSDRTPKVLNLSLGNPTMRKARSAFSNNFLGCLGYKIEDPLGFENISEAINAIKKHNPDLVVLCSSDQEYEQLVPKLCEQLNSVNQNPLIVLAGYPKKQIESYQKAGVDLFIHSGCNVLETLTEVQQKLNIIKNDK